MVVRQGWATEGADKAPAPGDPPPATEQQLLQEARSVYALGLLAVSYANEDYAGDAATTAPPNVPTLAARYLRRSVLDAPAAAPAAPSAAPEAAPGAAAAPAQAAVESPLCHGAEALRRLRLQYCAQALAGLGEYSEVLGPLLPERVVEASIELMRRNAQV